MFPIIHFWMSVLVAMLEVIPLVLFPLAWSHSRRVGTYNNFAVVMSILSCLVAVALYMFYR
jgi:hypothetical protein